MKRIFLIITLFLIPALAEAANSVYYSVGQNVNSHSSGGDIDGNPRKAPWDIGADEFSGSEAQLREFNFREGVLR